MQSASFSLITPLAGGGISHNIAVNGQAESHEIYFNSISRGYFKTMGTPVVLGREFNARDTAGAPRVAIVNQAFADSFFPGQDPIGERVRSNAPPRSTADGAGGSTPDGGPPWLTIVGVVSNTPVWTLGEAHPTSMLYMPMSIAGGPDIPPNAMLGPNVATMSYVVRSATSPLASLRDVRNAIDIVDRNVAIAQMETLENILDRGSAQIGTDKRRWLAARRDSRTRCRRDRTPPNYRVRTAHSRRRPRTRSPCCGQSRTRHG